MLAPPVPVDEIARDLSVGVATIDFREYSDKFSGFCNFEKDMICINQADSPDRRRFTTAHEFGHWILHKDKQDKYPALPRYRNAVVTKDEEIIEMEAEANYFAACILVPKDLLKIHSASLLMRLPDLKDDLGKLIKILCKEFDVSSNMMNTRYKHVSE